MFRTKILLGVLFVVCAASISNAANIIYVDVNGPNDPGTGSYNEPFRKIQDAIDAAIGGDTIEIQPGLYTGPGNRDLDPNGLSITIRSTDPNDPNVVAATIIDCNGSETEYHRGFYFQSGEDANCIISGLTIRNGYHGGKGGAIFCYYSSPTIMNCIISGNYAGTHGGGLFCQNSDSAITGCIISGNSSANDGGGVECWQGEPNILNCVISNNHANGRGGGVDYFDNNDNKVTLTNCTFTKNSADSGGALYCWGSNVVVNNSILWANEANQGPQIALEPYSGASSSVSVSYSDVQEGEAAVYDPYDALIWGSGNINADPCFASFDQNGDPNMWDFYLQSAFGRWDPNSQSWMTDSNTSSCIDAGDPNSDWTDEPWPNGKQINMGAYGGTSQASKNGNIADFDVSGNVDFVDLMELTSKWLDEEGGTVNLDLAGRVDFADFAIFAQNWLWQQE